MKAKTDKTFYRLFALHIKLANEMAPRNPISVIPRANNKVA